jgi:uncharacterized protein (TIGR04222 family)
MRRLLAFVAFAFVTLAPVTAGPAAAQTGGEAIRGYRVDIAIERDGTLRVVEAIDYDFGATARHGIFRDVPTRLRYDTDHDRVYRLHVDSVTATGDASARYTTDSIAGGRTRIKIGDANRTTTGAHTYTITYRIEGALDAFEDHDELYWNAIGADWDVPVSEPHVTVHAPQRVDITRVACFAGPTGSSLPCAGALTGGGTAQFTQPALGPHEAFTVVVAVPKGAVSPEPTPILDERLTVDNAFTRNAGTIGGALALLVLGVGGVSLLAWRSGRDRRYLGSPVDVALGNETGVDEPAPLFADRAVPVEFEPPDRIRPGQVGTIVDEVANPLDVTATIVDLAVRGYLRIEELSKQGLFGKPDWNLVQTKEPDGKLVPYESMLLDALFAGRSEVKLSDLKNTFASHLRAVQSALYQDVVERGWFRRRPDHVRAMWVGVGVVAVVLAGLATFGLAQLQLGLLGIPLVVSAIVLLAAAHWMPRRTAKGRSVLVRTLGFRRFIDESEKDRAQFAERANLFSEYLPYAVVFGATEKWARAFAGLDGQLPDTGGWYVGTHPFTIASFNSSMDHFTTTTAGTIASTPSGSGGSGFGGGGFSGGGGGGGGGGSW